MQTPTPSPTRRIPPAWAVALAWTAGLALSGCGAGGFASGVAPQGLGGDPSAAADAASRSDPGRFAAALLRDARYDAVEIEVDYPAGRPPSAEALHTLAARLGERCRKPGGVDVVLDDEIPASSFPGALDGGDLTGLEAAWRDGWSGEREGVLVLYVLCVPGPHADAEGGRPTMGLAFGGTSLALFLDATDRGGDIFATTAETQALVLVHEAGHLLGLVDGGTPALSSHEDPDHAHHCADASCVMAAAPRVVRAGPSLGDAAFAAFCPRCEDDLRSHGGR